MTKKRAYQESISWANIHIFRRYGYRAFSILVLALLSIVNMDAQYAGYDYGSVNYNFGSVNLGSSATRTITFIFTKSVSIASVSVVTQGAPNKDFQATTPDSSGTLCVAKTYSANDSCNVDITFSPLVPGTRLGAAVLRDSSNRIVASGYVTGFGIGAQLGFTSPTVSTFVGTGTYSLTNPSGLSGTSAGFLEPYQIVFDASGNMYMDDLAGEAIYKITPAGVVSTLLGTYRTSCGTNYSCGYPTSNSTLAASTASVNAPESIVLDGAGLLWFIDESNEGLATIDLATGYVTAQVPGTGGNIGAPNTSGNIHNLGAASLGNLTTLATDGLGNIYVGAYHDSVLTSYYSMILKLDPDGNISVFAGNTTPSSGKSAPADGTPATSAVIGTPWGMGFDGSGNFYYFDQVYNQIFKIDTAGKVHPFAGSGSIASDNTSSLPYWQSGNSSTTSNLSVNFAKAVGMLAVDSSGNVYLPSAPSSAYDTNLDSRVFVFTPSGYAYVLTGTGVVGEKNGPALSSELAKPSSVALNGTGDVYISENYIRQSTTSPAQYVGASVRKWSMAASTLSFGSQAMGSTSPGQTVTTTNIGNAPLELTTPSNGTNPYTGSSFTLLGNSAFNACATGSSGVVDIGLDCSVVVAFQPHQSSGSISGSLTYTGNLPGGTISVPMAGVAAPGVADLQLSNLPNPADSGTAYPVTVSAVDSHGNLFASYTGTVHFSLSPADGLASLPADYTFTASDAGTKIFNITFSASGSHTLTVQDTANNLVFNEGTTVGSPFNHFAFTSGPPTTTTAGISFPVSVTAYFSSNNSEIDTSYNGQVKITSSDPNAVLPSAPTLTSGVGTFTVTLKTTGTQTISVADSSGSSSIISNNINVEAAGASKITVLSGATQSAVIGAAFSTALQVQVTDAYSNPVGGVVVSFTPPATGASAVLSAASCTTSTTAPVGVCSVTATANGTASATAYTVAAKAAGTSAAAGFSLFNLKATPTVTLSEGSSTLVYGQPESLTATFAPASVAGTTPTAGMLFYDNGSQFSSAAVSSGSAKLTNLSPAVGTHFFSASYPGDTNFNATFKATATPYVTVTKASATLSGPAKQPVQLTQGTAGTIAINLAGQYSGTGISTPSGTVSYSIGSGVTGTATISNGAATVAVPNTLAPGTYTATISYGGDGNYGSATTIQVSVVVSQIAQTITFTSPASSVTYGSSPISLSATATSNLPVTFSVVSGPGTINGSQLSITGAGTIVIAANQAGNTNYSAASQVTQTVVVNKATPTLAWAKPAAIAYGTALSATQLDATATGVGGTTLAGTFTYSPTAGTVLSAKGAGVIQSLGVVFTPTDTTDYTTAQDAVGITVNPAAPVLKWTTPTAISYGVPLSATQLNATVLGVNGQALAGTTVYTPALGTYLTPGTHTLQVNFTPTDNTDYSVLNGSVMLTVNKAAATLTTQQQSISVADGQSGSIPVAVAGQYSGAGIVAPSATVTYSIVNASSVTVATGTITLSSGAGSVSVPSTLAPGTYTVDLSYGGDGNYAASTTPVAVQLVVNQIQPTISWAQPAAITYGTNLEGVLNAVAMNGTTVVPGTMTYTATMAGGGATAVNGTTVLLAGMYTLTATFTPTSTTTYKTATATVSLVVNKAAAGISLTTSSNTVLVQNPVTFTATVASVAGMPTGTVSFFDGSTTSTPIGAAALANGMAVLTTSALTTGTHTITAVYSGDANHVAATSPALVQTVQDFNLTISTSAGGATTATAVPGGTASYVFTLSPTGATTFPANVALSVSGLPTGATYTLSPTSIQAGSGPTNVTLKVLVPNTTMAALHHSSRPQPGKPTGQPWGRGLAPIALGVLLLPFTRRMRKMGKRMGRAVTLALLLMVGLGTVAGLSGCGTTTGYFGQAEHTYTVSITGTSGALVHSTTVTLNVQ